MTRDAVGEHPPGTVAEIQTSNWNFMLPHEAVFVITNQ